VPGSGTEPVANLADKYVVGVNACSAHENVTKLLAIATLTPDKLVLNTTEVIGWPMSRLLNSSATGWPAQTKIPQKLKVDRIANDSSPKSKNWLPKKLPSSPGPTTVEYCVQLTQTIELDWPGCDEELPRRVRQLSMVQVGHHIAIKRVNWTRFSTGCPDLVAPKRPLGLARRRAVTLDEAMTYALAGLEAA
jgi:hypothetical protein